MRLVSPLLLAIAYVVISSASAAAQDPPPPIGPFVVDMRGTAPNFPRSALLSDSRNLLSSAELPGRGLGLDAAAHLYLLRWKAMTLGVGGQLTIAQAHNTPTPVPGQTPLRAVTERFTSIGPQLSFNFGSGDGWSYVSGGIGRSRWSIVPDGEAAQAPDQETLRAINYGGGARWFIKRHLAFTFDIRFYDIDPGTPFFAALGRAGSPRTRLLLMGAGVSLR